MADEERAPLRGEEDQATPLTKMDPDREEDSGIDTSVITDAALATIERSITNNLETSIPSTIEFIRTLNPSDYIYHSITNTTSDYIGSLGDMNTPNYTGALDIGSTSNYIGSTNTIVSNPGEISYLSHGEPADVTLSGGSAFCAEEVVVDGKKVSELFAKVEKMEALENKVDELVAKVEAMQLELDLRPGGRMYESARVHFESSTENLTKPEIEPESQAEARSDDILPLDFED